MSAKAGYGKYETVNGQFYAGGPVNDTLALDIALTGQDMGKGFGRNLTRNEDSKEEKYWGARSKAVFTPSEDLKFTLAGDTYELKDNTALAWRIADGFVGSGGNLSPGGQDTTANDAALTSLRTWGLGLTVEADLGFATLTSISAARQNDQHSIFDTDGGPSPLIRMDYNSGTRSLQQELRLASNETDPLSWQAGMFWLRSRIYADALIQGFAFGSLNAGQHLPAELDTDTWAAFGEVTYSFTEKTHLTLGYRYTEDTRSFDAAQEWVVLPLPTTPVSDTLRYDEGTYRIALRQDLTDDVNVYASWNRGFKAGTFNMQSPLVPAVQPMSIDAYEVGVKSELFDRRVRFNVALFHYDMDDYQIRAASGATGSSFLLNAAKVETDGIDVEFEWAAMDNLSVYGGFTMLDAEYDSFPRAPFNYPHSVASLPAGATCPPTTVFPTPQTSGLLTTCSGNAKGNETAMSPDFTGSIGATYTMPLADSREVRLSALYNYNSGYYFEPDLTTGQSQYHVFNASVEYILDDNWSVALWGKNLTDDEYLAQVSSTGTGPFATLAPPRTYGVSVEYNY